MKTFLLKLKCMMALFFCTYSVSAQLTITPGGQFAIFSDTKLTLHNTDLINNGNFLVATTSPVLFTGNALSFIKGDEAIRFFKLQINKTGNQSVVLQKTISVGSGVFFTSGFLDLNGFDLDLETTGTIEGENNDSRFIGSNGGQVLLRTTLNAPINVNPGNLGIVFSSNQNLGDVLIKRGHQSQAGTGLNSSILRYFEVSPVNNGNVNATLRFNYFDGELNNIDENSLVFFKTNNSINWSNVGSSSRDAAANFVEDTSIDPFARFTLSSINIALPVRFILFSIDCNDNKVDVKWRTAQEYNSNYFNVERSPDGVSWISIGTLRATTNSTGESSYAFTDNSPAANTYYRIAEYDLDGHVQYTNVLRSSCSAAERFYVSPNPAHEKLYINIVAANQSLAVLKLFDSRGSLLKTEKATVLKGNNQISLDVASFANGIYFLSASWNGGQTNKITQIVKK